MAGSPSRSPLPEWVSSTWNEGSKEPDVAVNEHRERTNSAPGSSSTVLARAIQAGAAATALIVVIAGLWVDGYGPFSRSSSAASNSVSSAPTYAEAATAALAFAKLHGPGPWVASVAVGAELTLPADFTWYWADLGYYLYQLPCNLTISKSAPWGATVPAFTGNLSSGESPAWIIVTTNGTERGMVVVVLHDAAMLLETFGGGNCSQFPAPFGVIPSDLPSSSVAASLAIQNSSQAIVDSKPRPNVTMWAPIQSPTHGEYGWVVSIDYCPVVILGGFNQSIYEHYAMLPYSATFVGAYSGSTVTLNLTTEYRCVLRFAG